MAIAFAQVKPHSRGAGHSAVRGAAYRAGEKLMDERRGVTEDYSKKSGVMDKGIVLPENAPEALKDRAALWNAAEFAEFNKNGSAREKARLAREIVLALPHELNHEQRHALVREYGAALVERHGFGLDYAIHAPDPKGDNKNFHAHVMTTTRRIDETGLHSASKKTRELDDGKTGPKEIKAWRDMWEGHANEHLKRAGLDIQIDMSSYKSRGIDKQSEIHMGKAASEIERRGVETNVGNRNREIREGNASWDRLEELHREEKLIDLAIEREKRQLAERRDYLGQRKAERQEFKAGLASQSQAFETRQEVALGDFAVAENDRRAQSARERQEKLDAANTFWGKITGKHGRIRGQNAADEAAERLAEPERRNEFLARQEQERGAFKGQQKDERRTFIEQQLEQRRQRRDPPERQQEPARVLSLDRPREGPRITPQFGGLDSARTERLRQTAARETAQEQQQQRARGPGLGRE